MYETSPTEVAVMKGLCLHRDHRNDVLKTDQRKSYPRTVPASWERKPQEHSMCVGDCIDSDISKIDLPRKAYCNLYTDTAS